MLIAALLSIATSTSAAETIVSPLLRDPTELAPRAGKALAFRLAAGTEWDTNARRAIGTSLSPVVGDGVARLVAELESQFQIERDHLVELGYLLGAKRFFTQSTEDLLIHNLTASTQHQLSRTFTATTLGWLRASRMRSGARDYSLAVAAATLQLHLFDSVTIAALGDWTSFAFPPDRSLSYKGPTAGGDVAWRVLDDFVVGGRMQYTWRDFRGVVIGGTEGRNDTELLLTARASYQGLIRATLDYTWRKQRSNSQFEDVDRHRITVVASIPLVDGFAANVSATLQINVGTAISDPLLLAEDDENQNSVVVGLSRNLSDALSAEVRYALFANRFSTVDASFLRQTFYAGLSYRVGD